MPSPTHPAIHPADDLDIGVCGSVPPGLSGRMLGIGSDGVAHAVQVRPGRSVSYRSRQLPVDATIHSIVAFGDTILAFGDDSLAYEVGSDLDTLRRVDLAGHGRVLAPFPKHDPLTRDLHLVARATDGAHTHVVVSAGALTRRSRPILDVPNRITDLALTGDRVVFVADGFVGVAPRGGDARSTWVATGAPAPHPLHAHAVGDTVVLLALTPSLERWTVNPGAGAVQREVLDPTPRRFAHLNADSLDETPRFVWTTGDETIGHHDLADSGNLHRTLSPHVPGDHVFVADAARPGDADGGWLVGFVHHTAGATTELHVSDAADIAAPVIATVRIPGRIPHGLRCTWIPATPQ